MPGRVGRGLLALVTGAALGQIILVASTPFIARIYGAAAFGAFSALVAATSVIGPAAALKFDVGIVLPADESQARRLLRMAIVSSAAVAVATGAAIWLLGFTPLGRSWALVPWAPVWGAALVLATSLFTVLTQAALRERSYGVVAKRPLFQSLGTAAAQLGLGMVGALQVGLTAGFLFGRLFGFLPLIKATKPLLKAPDKGSYRATLREYVRLPTSLTAAALINSFGSNLPLLLIAAAFGDAATGEFGMAQRLVTLPATLLGASVAQVLGAELAQLLRERRAGAREIYRSTTLRLGAVAIVVGIAIVALAPLLPVLLGKDWSRTVPLAQAMSLVAAAGLIGSPLSQVYTVYQSRATALVDIIRVAIVIGAWGIAHANGLSLVESAWVLSIAQTLGYFLLWGYGWRLVRSNEAVIAQRNTK